VPVTLYALRPATEAEREKVAASWRTLVSLPRDRREGKDVDPAAKTRMLDLGPLSLARGWVAQALHDRIDRELETCEVVVADHPDAPGLPLGWLAFLDEPFTLLAMHVEAHARGQWVGRELLRHVMAGRPAPRCTMLTSRGRKLLALAGQPSEVAA
jgi:GNAT superfamily N-acetyltransferase